jgi:hypothetical protein
MEMNTVTTIEAAPVNTPLDRHANALANIQKMIDDLQEAREEIAQLKTDLHREVDRSVLLNEEREYYRKMALRLQGEKTELATDLANIGLLTMKAQDMVKNLKEEEVK